MNNENYYNQNKPAKQNLNILIIIIIAMATIVVIAAMLIAFYFVTTSKSNNKVNNETSTVQKNEQSSTQSDNSKQHEKTDIELTNSEIFAFIDEWQNFQTAKNISGYLNLYADDFQGIKRTKSGNVKYYDYNGWASDRTNMYAKPGYINITVLNLKITENKYGVAAVRFSQEYRSTRYGDKGEKIIKLRKEPNGNVKIFYEELLYSTPLYDEPEGD